MNPTTSAEVAVATDRPQEQQKEDAAKPIDVEFAEAKQYRLFGANFWDLAFLVIVAPALWFCATWIGVLLLDEALVWSGDRFAEWWNNANYHYNHEDRWWTSRAMEMTGVQVLILGFEIFAGAGLAGALIEGIKESVSPKLNPKSVWIWGCILLFGYGSAHAYLYIQTHSLDAMVKGLMAFVALIGAVAGYQARSK